jgi:mannose-6-phosphate isomerase-like protein (cupin superfamily)
VVEGERVFEFRGGVTCVRAGHAVAMPPGVAHRVSGGRFGRQFKRAFGLTPGQYLKFQDGSAWTKHDSR